MRIQKGVLEVYKIHEDLFPGVSKSDLSIQQVKIVHANVLRKKKEFLKIENLNSYLNLKMGVQKFGQKMK